MLAIPHQIDQKLSYGPGIQLRLFVEWGYVMIWTEQYHLQEAKRLSDMPAKGHDVFVSVNKYNKSQHLSLQPSSHHP